jgi:hypothetical protein
VARPSSAQDQVAWKIHEQIEVAFAIRGFVYVGDAELLLALECLEQDLRDLGNELVTAAKSRRMVERVVDSILAFSKPYRMWP